MWHDERRTSHGDVALGGHQVAAVGQRHPVILPQEGIVGRSDVHLDRRHLRGGRLLLDLSRREEGLQVLGELESGPRA